MQMLACTLLSTRIANSHILVSVVESLIATKHMAPIINFKEGLTSTFDVRDS